MLQNLFSDVTEATSDRKKRKTRKNDESDRCITEIFSRKKEKIESQDKQLGDVMEDNEQMSSITSSLSINESVDQPARERKKAKTRR